MSENRQTCFVIMPFSKTTEEHTEEYWTAHYEKFLKPLIEENPNLEARRSKPLRGDILNEIITDLVTSPIVVANLTDRNANVYWELGVRQSFKHGTITITEEEGANLPFDVSGKGTLKYHPKDYIQNEKFRRDFKEAIEDCLQNPDRPDSSVLETLSGRGTLFEIFRRDEAVRRLDAVISECGKNLEVLKLIIQGARYNQSNPDKKIFPTVRFGTIAIELLITNRYVDEEQHFFNLAEDYWTWTEAANDQISSWYDLADRKEKWLLNSEKNIAECIEDFKTIVEAARDKLSKRF